VGVFVPWVAGREDLRRRRSRLTMMIVKASSMAGMGMRLVRSVGREMQVDLIVVQDCGDIVRGGGRTGAGGNKGGHGCRDRPG
jgi:hypothetical protein